MIEEITLIKEILGDLTGVGIWGFIAFLVYGLAKTILTWGSFLYIVNKFIIMLFAHIKSPVSKDEHRELEKNHNDLLADAIAIKADGNARAVGLESEIERVKHMYKLLKEASDNASAK